MFLLVCHVILGCRWEELFWTLTMYSTTHSMAIISSQEVGGCIERNIHVRASIQTYGNVWKRTRLKREKYVVLLFCLFFFIIFVIGLIYSLSTSTWQYAKVLLDYIHTRGSLNRSSLYIDRVWFWGEILIHPFVPPNGFDACESRRTFGSVVLHQFFVCMLGLSIYASCKTCSDPSNILSL